MKNEKLWVGVLIACTFIAGGYDWWVNYGPYDITTPQSEINGPQEYTRFLNSLEKAYREDTVGFATPEETFDAFRKALKAGDYELASSYFVPEKQKEMLDRFTKNTNGYTESIIQDLYLENKLIPVNDHSVKFVTVPVNGGLGFGFDLIKNNFNNIWKMYEL